MIVYFLLVSLLVGSLVTLYKRNLPKGPVGGQEIAVGDTKSTQLLQSGSDSSTSPVSEKKGAQESTASRGEESSAVPKEKVLPVKRGGEVHPLGSVNINRATQAELEVLPGIGPVMAERIIQFRSQAGGFKAIEEIKNVKGVGEKTFERIKPFICVQ